MNAAIKPPSVNAPPASAQGLEDILFTLFRRKWLILSFVALGIVSVAALRLLRPPPFISWAKLMIRYVAETQTVPLPNSGERLKQTDPAGQTIINSEVEILTSLDVATNVARAVGPEKILAKLGGGNDSMAAAAAILRGISVEIPPRTTTLRIAFRHPDKTIVQPVLGEIIRAYKLKHGEVYSGGGALDEMTEQKRQELQNQLTKTEEQLSQLKTDAEVLFPDDQMRFYESQIAKLQENLWAADAELNARKAMLNGGAAALSAGATNATADYVPPEKLDEYRANTADLEDLRRQERELRRYYKDAFPAMQTVKAQIERLTLVRSNLVHECPALASVGTGPSQATASATSEVGGQAADVPTLAARASSLRTTLSNIQAQAKALMAVQPKLDRLQRQRDLEATNLQILAENQLHAQQGEAHKVAGINDVQSPTPPVRDMDKFMKLILGVFAGCVGFGLGLAFFLDLVWDRTIRRSVDIERHLRLPVFLTIPDTSWAGSSVLGRLFGRGKPQKLPLGGGESGEAETVALAQWDPKSQLNLYVEGLRERLMTYFEVNNLNLKKPKLVAVTGCTSGAGVSTLASSLAATLSKTGEGNVLLVDMNGEQGAAHPFYQGKPGCGLASVLEPENRAEALVQENLYVASMQAETNDKLAMVLPKRFTHLVPKLKASDYDYIIFDMPPVAPTSTTPRLASHMDIVLLVVESDNTGQHLAKRAGALMRESRANVAAVLNKYRPRVPARLAPEL